MKWFPVLPRLLCFFGVAWKHGVRCNNVGASDEVGTTNSRETSWRPHILMIVMDDLGSHDLGLHGTGIHTPTADQLAREGIYLDKYYVLPQCSPTRAALLSGRYPQHTGLHHNIGADRTWGLPLEDETLADLLHRGGYQTHAIGKWHVGHSRWEQTPTFRGFSSFLGFYLGSQEYYSHVQRDGGYDFRYDKETNCGPECSEIVDERGNYSTHVFTREAVRVVQEYAAGRQKKRRTNQRLTRRNVFRCRCRRRRRRRSRPSLPSISRSRPMTTQTRNPRYRRRRRCCRLNENQPAKERKDEPLFLYLAYQAVHAPNEVPYEYQDRYSNESDWTDKRKSYAGMLTAADESIQNVKNAMEQAGLWEDLLVIFTTDNGGPTIVGGVQGSSNHPKRGGKRSLWEGGTTGDGFLGGPALAKLGLPTGRRFPHLFHVVDWLPTLAEMLDIAPRNVTNLDGKSQLESLKGGPGTRQELFIGYCFDQKDTWYGPAIRYRNWKIVQGESAGPYQRSKKHPKGSRLPQPGGLVNSTYLLFDLETDPSEENNLAEQYPDILQDLIYKLQLYQESFVPPQSDDDSCPFTGLINTTLGPTWMPWCEFSEEIVVYS